jgi:diphthamide synthase (EF-2-diphthine--ammonia ligase)
MILICGPKTDQRTLKLELPTDPLKIAIFISGGIDSALLYYLLLEENSRMGNIHNIVPVTVLRKEGSKYFAKPVVAHVRSMFGLSYVDPIVVGNNTLPEEQQVKSGVHEVFKLKFDRAYTGLIEQLPQHMIGWQPIPYSETVEFKAPLSKLNKSHIIDLCAQLNLENLFYITHSCSAQEIGRCNNCNGCNERSWAFEQLNLTDPGKI